GEPELLQEGVLLYEPGLLAQVAEAAAAVACFARIGFVVARDQPQDGRLAAAIRPNQAGVLAIANDEVQVPADIDGPEGLGYVFRVQHESATSQLGARLRGVRMTDRTTKREPRRANEPARFTR